METENVPGANPEIGPTDIATLHRLQTELANKRAEIRAALDAGLPPDLWMQRTPLSLIDELIDRGEAGTNIIFSADKNPATGLYELLLYPETPM